MEGTEVGVFEETDKQRWDRLMFLMLQTIELGVRNRGRALIVCRDNVSQSRAYGAIAMYSPVGTMYLQGW